MTAGLKVYYAPRLALFGGTTLPGVLGLAPLVRSIVLRERITIVHGHTAFRCAAAEVGINVCPDAQMHSPMQCNGTRGDAARADAGVQGASAMRMRCFKAR
jgi:hypothetical protein